MTTRLMAHNAQLKDVQIQLNAIYKM